MPSWRDYRPVPGKAEAGTVRAALGAPRCPHVSVGRAGLREPHRRRQARRPTCCGWASRGASAWHQGGPVWVTDLESLKDSYCRLVPTCLHLLALAWGPQGASGWTLQSRSPGEEGALVLRLSKRVGTVWQDELDLKQVSRPPPGRLGPSLSPSERRLFFDQRPAYLMHVGPEVTDRAVLGLGWEGSWQESLNERAAPG